MRTFFCGHCATEHDPRSECSSFARFDCKKFKDALDSRRESRNMDWKGVSLQARISASSLTRIMQGKNPDIETFCKLCSWMKVDANKFITDKLPTVPNNEEIVEMLKTAYNALLRI